MAGFQTELSQMQSAAAHVRDVNASVNSLLSSLRGEVASVGGHWHGSSQVAFTQMMARYDNNAVKLNQALASIAEQIEASGRGYQASDADHEATFSRLGSGLNLD